MTPAPSVHHRNPSGGWVVCGGVAERAVVWKVTVAVAVVVLLLSATEATLKAQVVSEGMPEQREGESEIEPE